MFSSAISVGETISFPENKGERVYMQPFYQRSGLPSHLARWQRTVDQMLTGIRSTDGPIYLMIDQGWVKAGQSQRRAGLHVEGNWDNNDRIHRAPRHRHKNYEPEMILLASDVSGCRGVAGDFTGYPGAAGECAHIDVSRGASVTFAPYRVYRGNVTMLHESLAMKHDTPRTLVRLNLPRTELW